MLNRVVLIPTADIVTTDDGLYIERNGERSTNLVGSLITEILRCPQKIKLSKDERRSLAQANSHVMLSMHKELKGCKFAISQPEDGIIRTILWRESDGLELGTYDLTREKARQRFRPDVKKRLELSEQVKANTSNVYKLPLKHVIDWLVENQRPHQHLEGNTGWEIVWTNKQGTPVKATENLGLFHHHPNTAVPVLAHHHGFDLKDVNYYAGSYYFKVSPDMTVRLPVAKTGMMRDVTVPYYSRAYAPKIDTKRFELPELFGVSVLPSTFAEGELQRFILAMAFEATIGVPRIGDTTLEELQVLLNRTVISPDSIAMYHLNAMWPKHRDEVKALVARMCAEPLTAVFGDMIKPIPVN